MSPAWPSELRQRLYDAAAKNAETVLNPVKISIAYPRENITVLDVDGTSRKVSVPPCRIVLTNAELTPILVPDEPQPQSSASSQSWDTPQAAFARLPSHEIEMSLQGSGTASEHIDGYVHPTGGGLSLPFSSPAIVTPQIGSLLNPDVRSASPQHPACHGCASASFFCESTTGFPCRGCVDRNVPCVVTFYPQAPSDAYGGSVLPENVGRSHYSQQLRGEPAAHVSSEYPRADTSDLSDFTGAGAFEDEY